MSQKKKKNSDAPFLIAFLLVLNNVLLILQVYDRQLTPTNHLLMIWIKLGNNRINFLHFEKRTIIFG